jgi:hypothetical protein
VKPALEQLGTYLCDYVSCSNSLTDLDSRVTTILSRLHDGRDKRHVVFIDQFEKILDMYDKRKESQDPIQKWACSLVENSRGLWRIVLVATKSNATFRLSDIFRRVCKDNQWLEGIDTPIVLEPMTGEQLWHALDRTLAKLKAEFQSDLRFDPDLLHAVVEEYEKQREREEAKQEGGYALTYCQAVCYYLAKLGLCDDPHGLERLQNRQKLEDVILKYRVAEIIKSICQKDDRIIMIEVLRRMFDENRLEFFDTIKEGEVRRLLSAKSEFPEQAQRS